MDTTRVLENKVAIVTGSGSGIGKGAAISLAGAGAKVVVANRTKSTGDETVRLIREEGGDAVFIPVDVTDYKSIETLIAEAERVYGKLDIMFANAGMSKYADLEEMPEELMDEILATNLRGALLCAKLSIPALKKNKGGSIIFCSSVLNTIGFPGCVVYSATKAGLVGAARTLAVEVGQHNIRVNVVSPGTIQSPMLDRDMSDMNREEADNFKIKVRMANALGRIGKPEEIGEAVVWLCSDASSFVNGNNLYVDGGFTMVKRF